MLNTVQNCAYPFELPQSVCWVPDVYAVVLNVTIRIDSRALGKQKAALKDSAALSQTNFLNTRHCLP